MAFRIKIFGLTKIVLFLMFIGNSSALKAQCVDATFLPTFFEPRTNVAVNFLYWGSIPYDNTWTYDIDYGNGTNYSGSGALTNRNLGSATYVSAGIYLVELTVTDAMSCSETYSTYITVVPSSGCNPATWGPFESTYCSDSQITFGVSINGPSTINFVEWDFGDGSNTITTGNSVQYTYSDAGIYFVKARVHLTNTTCGGASDYAVTTTSGPSGTVFVDYRVVYVLDADPQFTMSPTNPVSGDIITFTYDGNPSTFPPAYTDLWDFEFYYDAALENSTAPITNGMTLFIENPATVGSHTALLQMFWMSGMTEICPSESEITFNVTEEPCDTCNSFKPIPGESYWLSAWVQVDSSGAQFPTYDNVSISLDFVTSSGTTTTILYPTGEIIDGWQRIAGEFIIPSATLDLEVNLNADDNNITYFDDIRIHPFNGSMKSYVYDGQTFWLVAELDDNNYATFYEYDAEGGLIRIKKETAGGIVTIQETRSSTIKISQ